MAELIINRVDNWFNTEFPEYDLYYICMKILEKASTNQKRGLDYNKLDLIKIFSTTENQEMIVALDKSMVFLISRGLVNRVKISDFHSKIYITDLGLNTYSKFKEAIHASH